MQRQRLWAGFAGVALAVVAVFVFALPITLDLRRVLAGQLLALAITLTVGWFLVRLATRRLVGLGAWTGALIVIAGLCVVSLLLTATVLPIGAELGQHVKYMGRWYSGPSVVPLSKLDGVEAQWPWVFLWGAMPWQVEDVTGFTTPTVIAVRVGPDVAVEYALQGGP
jgi:hypothetical protein